MLTGLAALAGLDRENSRATFQTLSMEGKGVVWLYEVQVQGGYAQELVISNTRVIVEQVNGGEGVRVSGGVFLVDGRRKSGSGLCTSYFEVPIEVWDRSHR